MITIEKTKEGKYIYNDTNITVRAMFDNWKIWLTKKQIAEIYWVKKSDIKKDLNELVIKSNSEITENIQKVYNTKKEKYETFYSLDIIMILWYKSKHFKETKFLINTNKLIKEYTSARKYRINKLTTTPLINKVFNYFDPTLKII